MDPEGHIPDDWALDAIGALGEPVRRALYRYVSSQPEPVSREQAAAATDVAYHVARFHLDRLVDDGLLEAEYRRPPGRGGPGAGRPARVYRRAGRDVEVSFPARRYQLAARLLAAAVATSERDGTPIADALHQAAHRAGAALGAAGALADVLRAGGYEPVFEEDGISLANCPFHALAREETELVCGMNLAFLAGVVAGGDFIAELDPADARCCVRLRADT